LKEEIFAVMTEVQLIIRFPESLAEVVNKALAKSKESIDIKLNPEETNNKSNLAEPNKASIKFGDRTFPALIGRLPCNIETHKTFDHVHYFKAGDIAEVNA
jgi:TATA-binding protein-associated factor Taf7